MISFIQMLATINTPTVQAPFGVSLLHPVLSIQGYDQNYMNYLQTKYKFYLIPFGNIYLFSIYDVILIKTKVLLPQSYYLAFDLWLLTFTLPEDGCSRNALCVLMSIVTFLLL
jgi:hypothetical protein